MKVSLQQINLLMKFTIQIWVIHLIFSTVVLAAATGNAQVQSVKEISINLNLKNASLSECFSEIQKQSELTFSFDRNSVADQSHKVSYVKSSVTVEEFLIFLSKEWGLSFQQVNRVINVRRSNNRKEQSTIQIILEETTVTGQVLDEEGAGLPGASVIIRGTSRGTITDFDGRFTIDVEENAQLVISYVGYKEQVVDLGNRTTLTISLVPDIESLEEIIVVGYGTVNKSDLTGSVSALKAEELNVGPIVSVDQMMLGRAAGVQISQSSSEPGGGLSIRIRGASSINASNEPLYVIDGFPIDNASNLQGFGIGSTLDNAVGGASLGTNLSPRNPLNSLNPNDIESIEILKDASATAIYGSRGANGVVMITTKKGKSDKLTINYNTYVGTQKIVNDMDVMTTQEYIQFINDVSNDQGNGDVFSSSDIASIGTGTDWQDQVYRTAAMSDNSISLTGGVGSSKIYASLDYFNQQGIVKNTGMEKFIGRLNLDSKIGEKTNIGFNINASHIFDRNGIDGVNTNESAGPIYTSQLYDPTEPILQPDGSFTVSQNLTVNNPVSLIEGVSSESQTNRTLGNFYISHEIVEGLTAKVNLGSDIQNQRRDVFVSTLTLRGGPQRGFADVTSLERSSFLVEYTMNYEKEINENHRFNLLGGTTYQKFNFRILNANIPGFPTDAIETNNLSLGDTNNDNLFSNREDNTLLSYLGRINYTLLKKFLFTGSIRADGSSRFGENNKYGYFPSFAFGYKLTEEPFVPDLFEELKVRASWGQTGNQEIGNYNSQLTFGTGAFSVFDGQVVGSVEPLRIANPDLKWETTTQFNIGIDASILNGKISTTLDYFSKRTDDLLFNLPLPVSSGYSSILTNIGEVSNKGFEFLINSKNVVTNDFSWNTSLNFTAISNKVEDLGRIDQIVTGNIQATGNTAIIQEGSSLASYYGYEVDGIQQSGEANPGFPNFVDQNGDGSITPADQVIIGSPFPDFTYGLNNQFKYKSWELSFFFQGVKGADLLNVNVIESMYPANFRRNRLATMLDRWTPQNTGAKWPSAVDPNSYEGSKVNTLMLQDASYLRLKNVTISYNFPTANINFLNSLRIYASAQNLFTITDYIGFDPEANSLGRNNVKVDYSSYPLARTFILGMNASF